MAMGRLRVRLIAKFTSILALIYFFVAIIVTMSRTDDPSDKKILRDPGFAKMQNTHLQLNKSMGHHISLKTCEDIHVAIVVTGSHQVLQYVQMLKTLIYFRDNPISLHVITNEPTRHILSTLLDTWMIPGVQPHFYTTNKVSAKSSDLDEVKIKLKLHTVLPVSVTKVIVLDGRMRLATNIVKLWNEFSSFSKQTAIEVYRSTIKNKPHYATDVLLLNLKNWRHFLQLPDSATASWENIFSWLESNRKKLHQLPCQWLLKLQPDFPVAECLQGKPPNAFSWDDKSVKFSSHPEVEQLKLLLKSIEQNDGELLRHSTSPCLTLTYEHYNLPKSCEEFRYASKINRRTHLYIYGDYQPKGTFSKDPHDVTLITQLTPDRFGVLETMATQWQGPLHAVFHVTEEEALLLPSLGQASQVISKRKNVAFHAVYKRGLFYPINYLRNVGINESATPYTVFIDVDLVPNNGLYKEIKKRIPTEMKKPKETLVVPAFEALRPVTAFPNSKAALLKLMENHTIEGYRMSKGWNLGHKPTNYPKWKTATKPYLAEFRDAFEPYVVLPTKDQPQFQETLLERMGDKIAYGRILYAMGYQFKVLPDQFVIHLPHPVSKGTNMWKSYPNYGRCAGVLFEEFRKETKAKYPWQKVH